MQSLRQLNDRWAAAGLRAVRVAGISFGVCTLAACAGSAPQAPTDTRAGLACVDDSSTCIQRRQSALRAMVADPSRKWVRERATPHAYATGVRLFAMKKKKRDLSCAELRIGAKEAKAAPSVLSGSGTQGLSPAQVSRGKMLAREVSRELKREIRRRCS